jgi:hypothetical protein
MSPQNPSECLRKAAEHIREVAEESTPGPWADKGHLVTSAAAGTSIAEPFWSDTTHIALWNPTVALLVADVFDEWARMGELDPDLLHRVGGPETLALARAILGGQS